MTHGNSLRPALYHRFHFLLPFVSSPVVRRGWRVLIWAFWLVYFSFILAVLALRYIVLPHVEEYRPAIERLVSEGLGQNVSIGRIEASWAGINPDLTLHDVRVADAEGRPALAFSRVETILSWWSVPSAQLRLRLLQIDEPTLHLRRSVDGQLSVAGIPLSRDGSSGNVSSWVLDQRRIRIRGATLVWEDELRGAPALILEDVNFALDNVGRQHRFGLTALPPEGLAARVDIRGDFRGTDFSALKDWSGQLYAEIDYADLAVWRNWVDYPMALPHGSGALRTWLFIAGGALREATADVALQDMSLTLANNLPSLDLAHMSGRLQVHFPVTGFSMKGQGLTLLARNAQSGGDPIRIDPTDFEVEWQGDGPTGFVGSAGVNRLDVGALVRLSAYLPFDAHTRKLLGDHAPRGQVSGLSAHWKGNAERLQTYVLKAGLHNLGLRAKGYFPGFSGISGNVDATEKGGKITLHSGQSSLDLPSVFPEPLIQLDSLVAQANWKINQGELEAELSHAEFAGPEAAGSAKGVYRTSGEGPGVVDMTAALTRADARAVWRYLPHVVGKATRHWLRDSLLSGKATEAKLILKGDLRDFPFLDKSKGQFLVTVKARDAVLDYGKDWPRIDGINGDLRFEGNGMVVDAQRGRILGARLSNTHVVIPDFDAAVPILFVKGQADGPTSEFLKFIDQSPVAEQIDHFTEDMRATGNGRLDIDLTIPLEEAKLGDSKIAGTYRMTNNEVSVDAALPPLRQVNGSIRFSGSDVSVPEITASLFGGPLKIQGGLQKDGRVLINANGSVDIAQLRKQSDHPVLSRLSGTTPYRGEIRINKRNADLVVETSLTGLASTLPEPFGKAAGVALPLRFEKILLPATANGGMTRDQLSASLGSVMSMQLVRRKAADGLVIEKGAVAIGRPLQLPEKGLAVSMSAKALDLDAWQKIIDADAMDASDAKGAGSSSSFVPDSVSLQTGDLLVRGMRWSDVDLQAVGSKRQWKIQLNSRQAAGVIAWDGEGNGRLGMRLNRLVIDQFPSPSGSAPSEATRKLPALDVVADEFSVRQLRFGRLELQASNDGATWNLNRIQVSNPAGTFTGKGSWQHAGTTNRTQMNFKVDSADVGNLLARMGYPGTVRAGTAQLDGMLAWNGPPTDIDYASMNGDLNLEAGKGQFLKLDPGAAGKLLGLISLQNLPRRITLDFKDVFSEGFAFDRIAGKLAVQKGVMRTERLQIDGTSARVMMFGEVDLKRETQKLNVNVRPEVGDTAALGLAIVNPAVGAATWLANKVLQNPLGGMFGYNYLITGTWDDPKVEKLSANVPAEKSPRQPSVPN